MMLVQWGVVEVEFRRSEEEQRQDHIKGCPSFCCFLG